MNPQRDRILHELGLGPQWRLREQAAIDDVAEPIGAAEAASSSISAESSPAAASSTQAIRRVSSPASVSEFVPVTGSVNAAALDWEGLANAVAECRACSLCQTRKQAVLGIGDTQANWLFVGEGPGAEEDERGELFVGQAGKLLDAMLAAIDLRRGENVYIANAVKCRPPNNRTPEPEETAACWPYLERQIELLQPKLIVALGRPAAQSLLQREVKIGAARGELFDYKGIPLIVTYHPAYLLRNLQDKAKAWEDLCFARKTMG
ncbi:MAG: uracil-DNA glycosylase [Rhodocyclaceae bacterium]|nr:uracil-DNA glycosylase [Rhodocyclaceae bacterium]